MRPLVLSGNPLRDYSTVFRPILPSILYLVVVNEEPRYWKGDWLFVLNLMARLRWHCLGFWDVDPQADHSWRYLGARCYHEQRWSLEKNKRMAPVYIWHDKIIMQCFFLCGWQTRSSSMSWHSEASSEVPYVNGKVNEKTFKPYVWQSLHNFK